MEFLPEAFSPAGPAEMTPGQSIGFKVVPDLAASPHPSWTKFYRLVKPVDRPIGTTADKDDHHLDGLEYLATTAKEHFTRDPGYRPPELVRYMADSTNVHLEAVPSTVPPVGTSSPRS